MGLIEAVTIDIDDFTMSVKSLKMQFFKKEGIEVQYQSLVYSGKPLKDGMSDIKRCFNSRKNVGRLWN